MSAIDEKYAALQAAGSTIGAPIGLEVNAAGGGRSRAYADRNDGVSGAGPWHIYHHPDLGAHEVHGEIGRLWFDILGRESGSMGYPISDELDSPHLGRVSHFQNGSIYWEPGRGTYEVWPPPAEVECEPTAMGRWVTLGARSGVVGVHAALLHTRQVLFFTYRDPGVHVHAAPQLNGASAVLDLDSERVTTFPLSNDEANLFCAGQAFLPDGRVLVGGGEREYAVNNEALHTFTPARDGGTWTRLPDLPSGRWYPTCVTLADGRVAIIGGEIWNEGRPRRANPSFTIYSDRLGPTIDAPMFLHEAGAHTYPFAYALPDGRLFIHVGRHTHFYDFESARFESTELVTVHDTTRTYGGQGTSVMLPLKPDSSPPYRARIMLFGGAGIPGARIRDPANDTCEELDLGSPEPRWQSRATMPHPRVMPDAVLLPDGKVILVNGSSTGYADHGANPVYAADLYDPETNRWTTLCNMRVPRLYHATALLLPDGRVLTAGTDSMWNPDPFHESQTRLEVFSPPYLFRGPRPLVEEAPEQVPYDTLFEVVTPDAESVDKVVLVRNGSCTHSFNSDQRLVELEIVDRTHVSRLRWVWRAAPLANRPVRVPQITAVPALRLRTPPNGDVAPPGYYMLFLLRNGVPSMAPFVQLSNVARLRLPEVLPWRWLIDRLITRFSFSGSKARPGPGVTLSKR